MAKRRLLRWIDDTGYRTNLTPVLTALVKRSDGTAVPDSPAWPTISRLGTSPFYYFDHDFSEDIAFVADCGDTSLPPQLRYRDGVAGPNDDKVSILQSPSGTYQVTVVTRRSSGERVPGVSVAIINQSGTPVGYIDRTNSNGEAAISLDAAALTFRGYMATYVIPEIAATISGGQTVEVICTPAATGTIPAGCQRVFGNILRMSQSGAPGQRITVEIARKNAIISGNFITTDKDEYTTTATGDFEFMVPKGSSALFKAWNKNGEQFMTIDIPVISDATEALLSSYLS